MIAFIRGIVTEKAENIVVLDTNGVGYEIYVSSWNTSDIFFIFSCFSSLSISLLYVEANFVDKLFNLETEKNM